MTDYGYIISPIGNSKDISLELLKLSVLSATDGGLYEVVNHPDNGQTALVVGDMYSDVLIHPNCDTTKIKELTPNYTLEEQQALDAYVDSLRLPQDGDEPVGGWVLGRFPFINLIAGYTVIYSYQDLYDAGWFPEDVIDNEN